jgi:hypothetical protein
MLSPETHTESGRPVNPVSSTRATSTKLSLRFLDLEASVVLVEWQIAGTRRDWQWRVPDDLLTFS